MSNSVKCVFQCISKSEPSYPGASVKISLAPRYADDKGNRFLNEFAQATPSGEMSFWCDNPEATARFTVGSFYDIVLTEREAPVATDASPAPTA